MELIQLNMHFMLVVDYIIAFFRHADLINTAIDRVLIQRQSDVLRERSLTPIDLFYREVGGRL